MLKDLRKITNRGEALKELAKISGGVPSQVKDVLREMGVTDAELEAADKAAKQTPKSGERE